MTEIQTATSSGPNRRTLLKGAAWSVPVLAATMAAPAAVASASNFSAAWGGSEQLQRLSTFEGAALSTANTTGPNSLSVTNGAGELAGPLTVSIISTYASGLVLSAVQPRGVGVFELEGATQIGFLPTDPGGDTPLARRPYTVTSTFTYAGSLASLAIALMNASYRYTSEGTVVSAGSATFALSLSVTAGSRTVNASPSSVTVPMTLV